MVSGVVAQPVVDGLEAVEVNHQDGDRIDGPITSGEGMTESVEQECPVRESRQRIFECLTRQLLFEFPADCDVARMPRHGRERRLQRKVIRSHLERAPASVNVANAYVEGGDSSNVAHRRERVECDSYVVGIKESIEWRAAEIFSGHSKEVRSGGTAVLRLTLSARKEYEVAAAFDDRFKSGTGFRACSRHRLDSASAGVPEKSKRD
jgi:hypothetical protein